MIDADEERTGGVNDYLEDDRQQWCSKCEHWLEDCRCPSLDDPMPLDKTESACDWIDKVCALGDGDINKFADQIINEDRYWNENVRDYPKNLIG